jgi:hypothetical protein
VVSNQTGGGRPLAAVVAPLASVRNAVRERWRDAMFEAKLAREGKANELRAEYERKVHHDPRLHVEQHQHREQH